MHGGAAKRPLRVVLWGTYDTGKPRIRILRDGLRRCGVEVVELHCPVWEDVRDKSALPRAGMFRRLLRMLAAYPRLCWRYLFVGRHDWVLVSYPGQLDALVLRPLAWLRGTPIALDWFISAYDTVVLDRAFFPSTHVLARLLWLVERLSVRSADVAFMDTAAHARRMEALFRLPAHSLGRVWVGVESGRFAPGAATPRATGPLRVLFYGQFIPLHGIDVIIRAARLAASTSVEWLLIGEGQESARVRAMLEERPLPNLRWLPWVDYPELRGYLLGSDLCLGIFGTSGKAASVIPNKVFQILGAGRPLVTRDSPAIRELPISPGPSFVLIPPGDPQALCDAVLRFGKQPPARTSPIGVDRIDSRAIARQCLDLLAAHPHRTGSRT